MRNLVLGFSSTTLLSATLFLLPQTAMGAAIPLIIDDDGSQDGLAGLAYMLANPKFDVKAITMSHGVARPENLGFQTGLKKMLGLLNATDIPVGIGSPVALDGGTNAFPAFVRNDADNFYAPFVTLPNTVPDITFQSAADLIVQTVNSSPEPVAILATGSMTNLAQALRNDPSIINNISIVQIMGGAVFVGGNLGITSDPPYSTNTVAEFNIWLDPIASDEVFSSGLNIQFTPLDGTNLVEFDRDDEQAWRDTGTVESILAAEFLDFSITVVGSDVNPNSLWDIQAAIDLSEANFSPETPLYIEIDTTADPGGTQGRTENIVGPPTNTLVSLTPSFANVPFSSREVFSYLEQLNQTVPEPDSSLGLLVLGITGLALKLLKKA